MILDLYTWMTTGNDSKYIHLQSMVIKGHKRSLEITRGKKLETSQRDPIFCMHAHIYIENYVQHVNMNIDILGGHMRSQKVKKLFSFEV